MSRTEFEGRLQRVIASSKHIGLKIGEFADSLGAFLDHAIVSVFLYEKEQERFTLRGTTLPMGRNGEVLRQSASGTIPALALNEKRIVSLTEKRRPQESRRTADSYVFPMQANGDSVGVVTVEHVGEKNLRPVRLDIGRKAVNAFADALGLALKEEAQSQKMARLAAITEFGVMIIATRDLDKLVSLASSLSTLIMAAEGCIVRLYDKDSRTYTVRECYGINREEARSNILKLEELTSREVLAGKKPLLVGEVSEISSYADYARWVSTFICVPLIGDGDALGSISIVNKHIGNPLSPPYFTKDDLLTFRQFAQYVEKAVLNSIDLARGGDISDVDEVTGLPNLKAFRARLAAEISRAGRFDLRFALIACDVSVHSSTGRASTRKAGRVMRRLAGSIRKAVREYDVVARIGEERFAVILPQTEGGTLNAVTRIKEDLVKEIESLRSTQQGADFNVKFSQFIFPDDGGTEDELLGLLPNGASPFSPSDLNP
jgi:diguanylate cyclase (GGDEF)-like protein